MVRAWIPLGQLVRELSFATLDLGTFPMGFPKLPWLVKELDCQRYTMTRFSHARDRTRTETKGIGCIARHQVDFDTPTTGPIQPFTEVRFFRFTLTARRCCSAMVTSSF